MIVHPRADTPTTQSFWLHDELRTGGAAVLYVDGVAYPATLSSTNDYSAVVTVSNLARGAHSYYAVLGADTTDVQTFTTQPVAGEDVKLLFTGDVNNNYAVWSFYRRAIDSESDIAAAFISEAAYLDGGEYQSTPCSAATISGITGPNTTPHDANYALFLECYRRKYNCMYLSPDHITKVEFQNKFKVRMSPNNHEFQTASPGPTSAPGENRYDAFATVCREYYYLGNPTNTDSDLDSVPTGGVLYWRETIGDIEIITPDFISYNDDSLGFKLNGLAQSRGEDKQLAWLKTVIANSTARIIILFLGTAVENNTEWTATGNLFETIDAKDKTIIALSANIHTPFARLISQSMATRPLLEVGVSPAAAISNSGFDALAGDVIYFQDDTESASGSQFIGLNGATNTNWVYCIVEWKPNGDHEDSSSHIKVKLKNAITGGVRWSCIIREGERTPRVNTFRSVAVG